ncbi:uncharacterized protein LOC121059076 [Cygnus olor]|uniref:uncharacterized protein LOC121059076 n=1 Tax=Cygnus olor TaxID=8869 RepID=UPI001ADE2076|nr:uncharacterized protein LOC121059076 [Cygnus olor]
MPVCDAAPRSSSSGTVLNWPYSTLSTSRHLSNESLVFTFPIRDEASRVHKGELASKAEVSSERGAARSQQVRLCGCCFCAWGQAGPFLTGAILLLPSQPGWALPHDAGPVSASCRAHPPLFLLCVHCRPCVSSISADRCVLWDFTGWGWSAANPAQKLVRGWLHSLRLVRDCSKRHSLRPAAHSCKPRHSTKMLENSTLAWHPLRLDAVPRAQNKALDAMRLTTPSRECDAAAALVRDGSGFFRKNKTEPSPCGNT